MGRLYNGNGQFVGIKKFPNGLRSIVQATNRKYFGIYPNLPWMPFEIIKEFDRLIKPSWIAYEIGSGMSTLWFAERVKFIISIEASKEWYNKLQNLLQEKGITNVDLRYEWVSQKMADFSHVIDNSLDLLVVDGGPREICFFQGFNKVKLGGYIYLDNWDDHKYWPGIIEFLENNNKLIEWSKSYTDYAPASFGVYEGLLIHKCTR